MTALHEPWDTPVGELLVANADLRDASVRGDTPIVRDEEGRLQFAIGPAAAKPLVYPTRSDMPEDFMAGLPVVRWPPRRQPEEHSR